MKFKIRKNKLGIVTKYLERRGLVIKDINEKFSDDGKKNNAFNEKTHMVCSVRSLLVDDEYLIEFNVLTEVIQVRIPKSATKKVRGVKP